MIGGVRSCGCGPKMSPPRLPRMVRLTYLKWGQSQISSFLGAEDHFRPLELGSNETNAASWPSNSRHHAGLSAAVRRRLRRDGG